MDGERIIDSLNDVKHTLNDLQKIVDNLELQINLEKLIDIRKDLRKKIDDLKFQMKKEERRGGKMNDFTINLEIYYLEKEKKDLEKLGDHSWSGEDFSHYIYICRRLDDLRREQNEQRQ